MQKNELGTQERILQAAKAEFLEKGFLGASLRNIVKTAGVTTGAFYGYYSNKEAVFSALVEPHAAAVMGRFVRAQDHFARLPDEEQPNHMGVESEDCIRWMIDYLYEDPTHFDAFRLIICRSEGTPYQNFVHQMVEIEVDATYAFLKTLQRLHRFAPTLDRQLTHIICSGMFSGIFEIVAHSMPKEQALRYVTDLERFYEAGWRELMNFHKATL